MATPPTSLTNKFTSGRRLRVLNLSASFGLTLFATPALFTPNEVQAGNGHGPQVEGSLDKDVIRRIVRAHINEVRHCYNQELQQDPKAAGRVVIEFKIGKDGIIAESRVAESDMRPELGGCIATAVARWKFPKPNPEGNVLVTYPFILEPG